MARIKRAQIRKHRLKTIREKSRGFFMGRSRLRQAKEAIMQAQRYSFAGRKQKKRQFRGLWIQRISAAVRPYGLSYSRFIHGLNIASIDINRKSLSELAIREPATFEALVVKVREVLAA